MDLVTLGIITYLIGIIINVMYPYLTAYLETGASFDYRYAISRVLGALLVGLGAIVTPGFVDFLQQTAGAYDYVALYVIAVFTMTMGAGSLGRQTQKFGSAILKLAE